MRYFILAVICVMLSVDVHAQGKYNNVIANADFPTEFIANDLDGAIVLRAWAKGRNRPDAKKKARKNAVHDVIFVGVKGAGLASKPLLLEVNAEEKYEDYFNAFFADDGPYAEFVSIQDKKIGSNKRYTTKVNTSYATTVTVYRAALKQKLIADGILKQK